MRRSDYAIPASALKLLKEPTPCEKFICVNVEKCKVEQLACASFHHYVNTGKALPPGTEFKKGKPRRNDGSSVPTHKRYKAIFSEG